MPLAAIEHLLEKNMGLHASTVGSSTVRQAVEQRMKACAITAMEDYLAVIRASRTELNALIDEVVIPETWFFRDRKPFSALRQWVTEYWLPNRLGETLRVLSIPCSTGEEPYTIAMTLAEAGLPPGLAQIDAVDISHANLDKARRASYGNNSFRGNDLSFRDRYFDKIDGRFILKDNIRNSVRFQQGNLLDNDFLAGTPAYHVVFCRNLLIYFDRQTQLRALRQLESKLHEDGLLFLGHAETSLMLERPFTPLNHPGCFGFRRATAKHAEKQADVPASRGPRSRTGRPRPRPATGGNMPFADVDSGPGETATMDRPPRKDNLETAFELADQGHLVEAAEICERLLSERPQADLYYLLGLVRKAAGNLRQADELLRKAIYLNPDHYEALSHLATLSDEQGDLQEAQRLRERAQRVLERSERGHAEA